MTEMAKNTLNRIWNRLADRYNPDSDSDCCGSNIVESQSETDGSESENCCE